MSSSARVEWQVGQKLLVADLENARLHLLSPVLAGVYRAWSPIPHSCSEVLESFQKQGLSAWEAETLLLLSLETLRRANLIKSQRFPRRRAGFPSHLYPSIHSYRL